MEINPVKIGYMQNFVKIRKSICFGTKCPNLGIWSHNWKIVYQHLAILKFWLVSGHFESFWGRYGSFQMVFGLYAGFGLFWLFPGFSKHTSGVLLLHIKIILRDLNDKKFSFRVAKRNVLTLKMNKQTNK